MEKKMELKDIPLEKIRPNPLQPREYFDREKIKELADSINEVGLINPIQARPKDEGYEIIAGERRWKACQIARKKTIPVIIKNVDDGELMVESLIENVHRENLQDVEKAKALKIIMEKEGIKTIRELAKITGLNEFTIGTIFDSAEVREIIGPIAKEVTQSVISETRGLPKEERKKIIEIAAQEELGGRKVRKMVSVVKKATEPIKEAIFKKEITPEVAEIITTELPEEKQAEAVKEVKRLRLDEKETRDLIKQLKIEAPVVDLPEKWEEIRKR